MRLIFRALSAVVLALCLLARPSLAAPDRVWIGPMPFVEGRTLRPDYLPTLMDASRWPTVLHQAKVLKLYLMVLPADPVPGKHAPEATDDDLRRLAGFVKQHRLKVAVEVGGIRMGPDTPNDQAGATTAAGELTHLRRWLRLGGRIDYLTTDHAVMLTVGAPYVMPSQYKDRGMTLSQAIEQLAIYFEIVHREIPGARFGAIESLGFFQVPAADGRTYSRTVPALPPWRFDAFLDELIAAMRLHKVALDHFHIDFGYEGVKHDGGGGVKLDFGRIRAVEGIALARRVHPGVIVNAFHDGSAPHPDREAANRQAFDNTLRFAEGYRQAGGRAAHIVVQTWQPYPDATGPEAQPNTVLYTAREVLRVLR